VRGGLDPAQELLRFGLRFGSQTFAKFRRVTAGPDYLSPPETLKSALDGLGAADLVLLAAQALRVGSLDSAAAICEALGPSAEPALVLTHAAALFGLGEHTRAIAMVDGVLARQPAHLPALFYRAQMAQHAGDGARATTLLLTVLERFPDFPGAQGALASLRLPGPPYRDVLRRLHELRRPRTYLEIGVETGATLAFAHAAARAIGIDPDASKLRRELVPACAKVFHETSDAFFARQSREQALGEHRLDFAFIDGMHWFEYALRDFMNVEAWSDPNGVVVLHDCLPLFPLCASRERRTKFWVGDVWKVVSILREHRPELRVKIVATAPSGLCIVRGLDPSSRVLHERLQEIVERHRELPYPVGALETPPGFELVPANEAGLRAALQ
jgi:predicted O-methyltransferase YrrM